MTRARVASFAVVLVVLAAGCGGGGGGSSAASAPARTASAQQPVDPDFDFGQRVTITSEGFRPLWLVSIIHQPVIWTNDTDTPQTIVFDHLPVHSGVIQPGGTFTFTPDTVASITYHSEQQPSLAGRLQASWSASDEAQANSEG